MLTVVPRVAAEGVMPLTDGAALVTVNPFERLPDLEIWVGHHNVPLTGSRPARLTVPPGIWVGELTCTAGDRNIRIAGAGEFHGCATDKVRTGNAGDTYCRSRIAA